MVIVSDWWAAISQKAPSSDSGLKVLTLAAGLLILAPQLDWPAPRKIVRLPSEDDEKIVASTMDPGRCPCEGSFDVMNDQKLECCKEIAARAHLILDLPMVLELTTRRVKQRMLPLLRAGCNKKVVAAQGKVVTRPPGRTRLHNIAVFGEGSLRGDARLLATSSPVGDRPRC
jgi:hypothetical protein